jgi:hypothetical protein
MVELWVWRGHWLPLHRHIGDAFVEITSVTATQRSRLHEDFAIAFADTTAIYSEDAAVRDTVVAADEYANGLHALTKLMPLTRLLQSMVDAVYQG